MLRRNTPQPLVNLSRQPSSSGGHHHQMKSPASWRMTEPRSPGAISTTSFMSSFSWVAEKSSSELTALLKKAYESLREKERDLSLAAEIGNSLLENNTTLKSRYEELLSQIREYKDQHNDSANESEYDDSENETTMRLISSQRAHEALIEELERKNTEMEAMLDSALKESAESGAANEKHARKLEKEIELLRSTLDDAAQKIEDLETQKHRAHCGRLSSSTAATATAAAAAAAVNTNTNTISSSDDDENSWLAQELAEKMMQMEAENEQLAYAKRTIEDKLAGALGDLEQLRRQFGEFQFTQEGYDNLQEAYHRQFKHIEELNSSLEDHRTILARLRDRGIGWSPKPSPSPSEYGGGRALQSHSFEELRMTTPKQSLLHELENAWLRNRNSQSGGDDKEVRDKSIKTFEDEIRSVSSVNQQKRQHKRVASLTEQNLASFYRAPAGYALEAFLSSMTVAAVAAAAAASSATTISTSHHRHQHQQPRHHRRPTMATTISNKTRHSFDIFATKATLPDYAAYNLYPRASIPATELLVGCRYYGFQPDDPELDMCVDMPSSFIGCIFWFLQSMLRVMWRWCRFSVVLLTAILINLWQGPDAIMEK